MVATAYARCPSRAGISGRDVEHERPDHPGDDEGGCSAQPPRSARQRAPCSARAPQGASPTVSSAAASSRQRATRRPPEAPSRSARRRRRATPLLPAAARVEAAPARLAQEGTAMHGPPARQPRPLRADRSPVGSAGHCSPDANGAGEPRAPRPARAFRRRNPMAITLHIGGCAGQSPGGSRPAETDRPGAQRGVNGRQATIRRRTGTRWR